MANQRNNGPTWGVAWLIAAFGFTGGYLAADRPSAPAPPAEASTYLMSPQPGAAPVLPVEDTLPEPGTPPPEPVYEPVEEPVDIPAETVYYRNCSAARAAGAAPVRIGDPGYAPHLDRDNDGVGCE